MLTVRAALCRGVGEPIEVLDIQLPATGPGQVRVRIAAAGVCHSDLSLINGTLAPSFPLIPGHEASGVVTEVGAGVTSVAPGQHVVINWAPACRRCWFCLHDEPWLCAKVEGLLSAPGAHAPDGSSVHLAMGVGAFAEEVLLGEGAVVPISDDVPLPVAALLGCAALTGIGAVENTAGVRPGESVLVLGLGGIGLSAVAGARLAGASRIIAVDVNPQKERIAREMGATDALAASPELAKQVRALTEGRGVDHAFDCVGAPSTIRDAWRTARRGGRVTIVGVGRRDAPVSFNPLELFHFNRVLQSSIYGSSDPARDVPLLAEQIRLGHLDLGPLVTERIALDDLQKAFDTMGSGGSVRSVVLFDQP